jgi:hypothetical protein
MRKYARSGSLVLPIEVCYPAHMSGEDFTSWLQSDKREEVKSLVTKATKGGSRDKADRRAGTRQGPYVRSGMAPRARNNDGAWRKKRSDAGKKRGK